LIYKKKNTALKQAANANQQADLRGWRNSLRNAWMTFAQKAKGQMAERNEKPEKR